VVIRQLSFCAVRGKAPLAIKSRPCRQKAAVRIACDKGFFPWSATTAPRTGRTSIKSRSCPVSRCLLQEHFFRPADWPDSHDCPDPPLTGPFRQATPSHIVPCFRRDERQSLCGFFKEVAGTSTSWWVMVNALLLVQFISRGVTVISPCVLAVSRPLITQTGKPGWLRRKLKSYHVRKAVRQRSKPGGSRGGASAIACRSMRRNEEAATQQCLEFVVSTTAR